MNENVAITPQPSAMNEVIAYGEKLGEILVRVVGCHHAKVVLLRVEMLGVVVNGENVCDLVHRQLV